MLTCVSIKNVVLIKDLCLDVPSGLLALTGETGAGKSILLDSLGLALGGRAEMSLISLGEEQAIVTASFALPLRHPALRILREQGLLGQKTEKGEEKEEKEEVLFRRILARDGRSRAYINDSPVSIGLLREVGETLVEIHGQFETHGLLNPAMHREILDAYAENGKILDKTQTAHAAWREKQTTLNKARQDASRIRQDESWLEESLKELEKLAPQEGEEETLLESRRLLQNRKEILEALEEAEEELGGEDGADMKTGRAWRRLHRNADKIGEGTAEILAALDRASAELQSASRRIQSLKETMEGGEGRQEGIEDRLHALRAAGRKYGVQTPALPALANDFRTQLEGLKNREETLSRLEAEEKEAAALYVQEAATLRNVRTKAAARLDTEVGKELSPLKLGGARFATILTPLDDPATWGPEGMDQVRFTAATNGEGEPGPLHKIASGGEMARFMLALKVVLAESKGYPRTYVFDEIDTGIGGATASAVGERLARLAKRHQVLVVTHSPQVAARATAQGVVAKAGGRTSVAMVGAGERKEEIARMLSGSKITEEARAAAAKLLEAG